jgi:hypothetical protein
MIESAIVYAGLILAAAGVLLVVKPIRRLRVTTRSRGLVVAAAGLLLAGVGLILPVSESRVTGVETRLDEFAPAWQFREFHTIRVAAPPSRVFEAVTQVRADEIALFRTLTWIRRGGQPLPVVRENQVRRSNPMNPGTRSSGPPLVLISRGLKQTTIAPGKPLVRVTGTHSAKAPVSERGPTTTTQPAGSRDATRSTQESPQVCHPTASAHRLPGQDPVSRSVLDARGRGYTSR